MFVDAVELIWNKYTSDRCTIDITEKLCFLTTGFGREIIFLKLPAV